MEMTIYNYISDAMNVIHKNVNLNEMQLFKKL